MKNPTPISTLLHNSTIIITKIFLLIHTKNLFSLSPHTQSLILILKKTTTLFTTSTTITQHNIKKIITYSTTKQLKLIITTINIKQPTLTFFHIYTHTFFKTILFLYSKKIIHKLKNKQNLQKIKNLKKLLPITSTYLILNKLTLINTPFLTKFYSKNLILKTTKTKILNLLKIILKIITTILTTIYNFQIIFFYFSLKPSITPLSPIKKK
ncbi:proton-conducting transporter membrane subunit, partial [Erythrobacter sanguineus]|uniref:proton-conducting transporter transmembrane domain-containing protein n=1 Tax=Erythrobacter sanguineus TaxID=198312 RepID=UPI003D15FD8A